MLTPADPVGSRSRYVLVREFASLRGPDYQLAINQPVTTSHPGGCVPTHTEHSVIARFGMTSLTFRRRGWQKTNFPRAGTVGPPHRRAATPPAGPGPRGRRS